MKCIAVDDSMRGEFSQQFRSYDKGRLLIMCNTPRHR